MECNNCENKINISWVKVLPKKLCGNAIYFVKSATGIKMYVTNYQGVPSLIGETSSSGGGNTIITSPDQSITVGQSGQTFEISVSQTLQALVNGALQEGDNITLLNNDAGYITLADIVTSAPFHPIIVPYVDSQTFTLPPNVVALDVRPNGTSLDVSFVQVGDQVTYTGTPLTTGDFWVVVGIYANIPMGTVPNLNMVTNQGSSSDVNIQTPNAVSPQDLVPLNQVEQLIADAGGAVDSVNSQTGVVVLDADDIDDTTTTNKFTTSTEITKLAGIEDGAEVNNISDINATDLTDGNNSTLHFHTADRDRANHVGTQLASTISDFSASADARVVVGITGKENTITPTTTADYYRGDKTFQPLNKTAVGLGNVDNTTDLLKPISTTTQNALNLKQNILFEINDTVPSANVASVVETLIKTYDVESLATSSRLYFHFRGRRTGVNNETMSYFIYLKEKTSATRYFLGTHRSGSTARYFPIERTVTLRPFSNEISVMNTGVVSHTDVVSDRVDANTVYTIDYTKDYEIQVFGLIGFGTTATWQNYFSNIIKR